MGSKSNSLNIRLTESVVFLKPANAQGRRRDDNEAQASMLRGLLTLELVKPTRISSIEIRLQGKTCTAWPEGVGARRIEVSEEHKIFSSTTVFFRADSILSSRRAISVGPGLAPGHSEDEIFEQSSEDESHLATPRNGQVNGIIVPPQPSLASRARRPSADSFFFRSNYLSHHEDHHLPPTPPYTPPYTPSSSSPITSERPPQISVSSSNLVGQLQDENPAQNLADFRNTLRAGLESRRRSSSDVRSTHTPESPSGSARSSTPLSRHPSIEDVPEDEPGPSSSTVTHSIPTPIPSSAPPDDQTGERRGRRSARFSFTSVSNAFIDAMKDHVQPKAPQPTTDTTNAPERHRNDGERGRTLDNKKGKGKARQSASVQKERFSIGKLGDLLGLEGDENKEFGDGWKEFKKGTYTFPIGFAIPGNSPPSLSCAFGSVSWYLKAEAHRPGTFTTKLQSRRDVILIACPEDIDDAESIIVERIWDTQLQYMISVSGKSFYIGGTIPIQFKLMPLTKMKIYQIAVWLEERIEYFTLMRRLARADPVRHNLLLSIKSGARGKEAEPILPLSSDDMDAFMKSPMYSMLTPDDDPSEMASSLMGPGPWSFQHNLQIPASCTRVHFTNRNRTSNMTITHTLKITMRVERGDDEVMDAKSGRRKLFDILVHLPVQILSCRCNPEWTSLPSYSEGFDENPAEAQTCPCIAKRLASLKINTDDVGGLAHRAMVDRMNSRLPPDLSQHPPDGIFPVSTRGGDPSLFDRNNQFERLVSGQESEIGEAPPSYVSVGN